MASLNQCNFIGNLGGDPELRYMQNGKAVAKFSIACNEKWKDKETGQQQERTEWVNVSAFGRLAEIVGEYLKKGSQVYVSGKMQTNKAKDREGLERYYTGIIAGQLVMLGSKEQAQNSSVPGNAQEVSAQPDFDDSIPF